MRDQPQSQDSHPFSAILLMVAVALLFGLHLIPFLIPDARLWGFNHLLFLPLSCTYGYIVLAGLAPALFFKPFSGISSRWFDRAAALFETERKMAWLTLAGVALLVFWFLRMPTTLLGDGYSVINNIGGNLPVVFKWSEALAVKTAYLVSRMLPLEGLKRGEYAYAVISVLSGGVVVFFFGAIAYELGRDKLHRLMIFCLLLFSGSALLFFGYAENYPILWPFVTGYVYFSIRYMMGKGGLLMPSVFLIVAAALHLQVLFYLVSYPFLLISRGRGAKFYRQHKRLFWSLAGIALIAGLALFIYKYNQSFGFMIDFLPPFQGRPATPNQAIFLPEHWLDIINEIGLLIPLWLILILLSWKNIRMRLIDPINRFLLAFSLGGFVFISIIDPRLGMGRDWDLFALIGLGPVLLMARNIDLAQERKGSTCFALAFLSLLLTVPFLTTNLSRQPSIRYLQSLLRLDLPRSQPGMVALYGYYHNAGNQAKADSLEKEMTRDFPARVLAIRADSLVKSGRLAEARQIAESLYAANPYALDVVSLLGEIDFQSGKFEEAARYSEKVAQVRQYDPLIWLNLSWSYQNLGRFEDRLRALRKAQELSPRMPQVITELINMFATPPQYDSTYKYARQLIEVSPNNGEAYYIAGISAYQINKRADAKRYLYQYLSMTPSEPSKSTAEEILKKMP